MDPALAVSFLHWGFLAWALVATTTTITFSILERRGEPLRPRSLLVNIAPRGWVDGPLGDLADGLSVVAAIAGTVGPLGFLSLQLSNAAGQLPWLSDSAGLQSLVVVLLTAVFATSTVSGIQKGIKWLSELNVWLTLAMAAALLLLGPGLWLMQHFCSGFLTYLMHLPQMALTPNAAPGDWINGWTVFYWGWFLGYAPLMGLFTAGVSRGRSIRELVLAVAILCPIVTNLWFTLLGGTGLHLELADGGISEALAQNGAAAALLAILSQLAPGWSADPDRTGAGGAVHVHQRRFHELCRSHGGERPQGTTGPAAPVLGSDDRQPDPGAAAHRHGPGRQHLDQCTAGLHRDHRGAGDTAGAGDPLERATAGLEGMAANHGHSTVIPMPVNAGSSSV